MDLTTNLMSWIEPVFARSALFQQGIEVFFLSYILGCVSTGYYFVRLLRGKDIRKTGSGNIGARNVGRELGNTGFAFTLLVDAAKGALAVWIAKEFSPDTRLQIVAMLAVVIGHNWPVQLGFRGGKGVSTSIGALLVFDYYLLGFLLATAAVLWIFLRKITLSGLLVVALMPLIDRFWAKDSMRAFYISALALIILWAHRKNIADEISHFHFRRSGHPKPDDTIKP